MAHRVLANISLGMFMVAAPLQVWLVVVFARGNTGGGANIGAGALAIMLVGVLLVAFVTGLIAVVTYSLRKHSKTR